MMPKITRAGESESAGGRGDADVEVDARTRRQYLAILQYLRSHELMETLCAMEAETGVSYEEGSLPQAALLEGCFDMFEGYAGAGADKSGKATESSLQCAEDTFVERETGVCCTGAAPIGDVDEGLQLGANVTAVCWAPVRCSDMVSVVASADRRIRVLDSSESGDGNVLCEYSGLPSPPLSVDASREVGTSADTLILVTMMGGEAFLLQLRRPLDEGEKCWTLELVQQFKNHQKHSTAGKFSPPAKDGGASMHFLTISRDHQALVYSRRENSTEFLLAASQRFASEVTSCCWVSPTTFALAVRDDHQLHYWDVASGAAGGASERSKVNLNALGDSVVSFAVLSLTCSSDGAFVAICTDKSRIIVMPVFSSTQIRNLYGATVDEYDVPTVRFSLDGTFLYATSSLPHVQKAATERDVSAICGEIAIFELRTGELVLKLPCHTKPVRCLDRHPFKEALVTGSFDKTVRFWC
eukprot:TRINITY_DN17282_c0_g1_i1.p1 TRINITY_DN17282_c0_g1~~TRINITY_DN17282_c0_g1_i1.p1  ORF type:complete len:470 (-),score=67.51 TRINITY_DN17282_c0_g1_i1:82-1491(-)